VQAIERGGEGGGRRGRLGRGGGGGGRGRRGKKGGVGGGGRRRSAELIIFSTSAYLSPFLDRHNVLGG